jgi:hypothetical protein
MMRAPLFWTKLSPAKAGLVEEQKGISSDD